MDAASHRRHARHRPVEAHQHDQDPERRHRRIGKDRLEVLGPQRLEGALVDIRRAQNGLQQLTTQFAGSLLRESDFLNGILNRSGIPGGTCGFDLPHYHAWLSQPYERVRRDLDAWFADLRPFEQAINLYLRLLRNSVPSQDLQAQSGIHIHTPSGPCLLVRVLVLELIPLTAAMFVAGLVLLVKIDVARGRQAALAAA